MITQKQTYNLKRCGSKVLPTTLPDLAMNSPRAWWHLPVDGDDTCDEAKVGRLVKIREQVLGRSQQNLIKFAYMMLQDAIQRRDHIRHSQTFSDHMRPWSSTGARDGTWQHHIFRQASEPGTPGSVCRTGSEGTEEGRT